MSLLGSTLITLLVVHGAGVVPRTAGLFLTASVHANNLFLAFYEVVALFAAVPSRASSFEGSKVIV